MSSDSDEDDCYGNIAQKLQTLKNKYSEDKIETTNLLDKLKTKTDNSCDDTKPDKADTNTPKICDTSVLETVEDEDYSLDAIIARNSKKRPTRSCKRTADVCVDNIINEKVSRTRRGKQKVNTPVTESPNVPVQSTDVSVTSNSVESGATVPVRGRGRGRGRGTPRQPRGGRQPPETSALNESLASRLSAKRSRNKTPRRGRGRFYEPEEPLMYDLMAALAASSAMANGHSEPRPVASSSNIPTYSVGNTDEYPDQCDSLPLFNTSKPKSDVIVVDENDADLDENEELSVKVYWQNSEYVRFNIRRFQKLTQIFDHFAEREKVGQDKLFFTYNDKILKSDDTPDSISYSIAKFIDGGIVHQSVSSIMKKDSNEGGIKLKFQCQNVKKPFVTNIQRNDKLLTAMIKCAEHLEKPLDKLKFCFDGDTITGKSTALELELEGGECIDVQIIS